MPRAEEARRDVTLRGRGDAEHQDGADAQKQRRAAARLARTPIRRASSPKPSPAIAETSEKVLTMVAADAALRPRSIRCGAWCRLMPACTGIDRHRVERQQPERRRAQRLAARERGLGKRWRWLPRRRSRRRSPARPIRQQAHVLRPPHHEQPGRHEADDQHRGADRQPPRAPAILLDGEVRDQGQRHQARHLRQIGDRGGEGAARDEPAVERAVDADVEGGWRSSCGAMQKKM